MATIQILSQKTFRFKNPNASIVEADVLRMGSPNPNIKQSAKFEEVYFTTTPGVIQTAPAWIKQDELWKWARKDNAIAEIVTDPETSDEMNAKVAEAKLEQNKALDTTEPEEELEPVDLDKMKKEELLKHTYEVHGLDIEPKTLKPDIIEQIREAEKKAGKGETD